MSESGEARQQPGRRRGAPASLRRVEFCGLPFYVRRGLEGEGDLAILREVVVSDVYGLRRLPSASLTSVVDVGCHIGGFSRLAAALHPGARVYAFEAQPANHRLAERNLEGLDGVTLFEGALVGEPPEDRDIYILNQGGTPAGGNTGGWSLNWYSEPARLERVRNSSRAGRLLRSPVSVFLEVRETFDRLGLDRIGFLKLDCEGSEASILEHLPDRLLARIGCIAMETHSSQIRSYFSGRDGSWQDLITRMREFFDTGATRDTPAPGVELHFWRNRRLA